MLPDCIDHGCRGNADGYSQGYWNGYVTPKHRIAWAKAHGYCPAQLKGLVIRHRCDNPRCINPAHLESGTIADNNLDKVRRSRQGRTKKLTAEQVQYIRSVYTPRHPRWGGAALGRALGVTTAHICSIAKQRTRKHIHLEEEPNHE